MLLKWIKTDAVKYVYFCFHLLTHTHILSLGRSRGNLGFVTVTDCSGKIRQEKWYIGFWMHSPCTEFVVYLFYLPVCIASEEKSLGH